MDSFFQHRSESGTSRTGIPFAGRIVSRLDPTGHLWFANSADYRIYKRTNDGDTVLVVSREFEPLPVTGAEVDSAIFFLEWFTRQGGRIDRSRIPSVRPALTTLYVDDESQLWVVPVLVGGDSGRQLDVFNASGRYLGRMPTPFRLSGNPIPIFRRGRIYAVTMDEFGVPYVVRGRIKKP